MMVRIPYILYMTHASVSASTTASQCLDKPHSVANINEDAISASATCGVRNYIHCTNFQCQHYCLLDTDYFI